MFIISKNQYKTNGKVYYSDEFGDSVFCKRTEKGFVAKLRFNDGAIKVNPVYVDIPVTTEGYTLNFSYPKDVDMERYQPVIDDFQRIVSRWICMCYDLEILEKCQKRGEPIEESLCGLSKYSELYDIIGLLSH